MLKLPRSSPRPPQLRRKLAVGGAGLMALAVVTAVGFIYAASKNDKIHAAAVVQARQQLASEHVPGEVVVGYKTAVSDQSKRDHRRRHSGSLKERIPHLNLEVITVATGAEAATLEDLKTQPDVAYAEPNFIRRADAVAAPTDPNYFRQWGYVNASFPAAWNITTGAGAPLIADLDTGADLTHPDLAANVAPGGWDFVNNDADPTDDDGHGTSTMGIIAAVTNNGIGGAGGCWTCKVMPIKVLDNRGNGSTSNIIKGFMYAVDHGAKILNVSLGGDASSTAEQTAVTYVKSKGAILVASVCEDAIVRTTPHYPASYPGTLSVGALAQNNTIETWSCTYGQINAPSYAHTTALNHGYASSFSGTSAATPFVAAAVALVWAAHPTATREQIIDAIVTGSDTCCSATGGVKLNVGKAISVLGAAATPTPTPADKTGDANVDGLVDVFDLSYLLAKWGTADTKADLNMDGTVNVLDLSLLISNWAP